METSEKIKVLVTGAYGLIGNLVYARLAAQPDIYEVFGSDRKPEPSARVEPSNLCQIPDGKLRLADVSDFNTVQSTVEGMNMVVHLAGESNSSAEWESVLQNNIVGTRNIFEACRLAGVKRVVYASTNQVMFGYAAQERSNVPLAQLFGDLKETQPPLDHTLPTRPLNYYACSKVFGEALAHMYAYKYELSCICLRIGWVVADDRVPHPFAQRLWCSKRDVVQLVERCLQAPDSLRFDVFFGQSVNRYNFVDIQHAKDVLGYAPQDRAEDHLAGTG